MSWAAASCAQDGTELRGELLPQVAVARLQFPGPVGPITYLRFSADGSTLVDGKYTLNFFQESMGETEKTVTVKDGKVGKGEGNVEMDPAAAVMPDTIREINVSVETGMPSCCSGKTDDADAAKSEKSDAAKSELKAD